MKAFGVAVLVLCLNFMCGIIGGLPIGLISSAPQLNNVTYSDLESQINTNSTAQFASTGEWDPVQYVSTGISLFFNVIWRTTFGFPAMLSSPPFSLPTQWVLLFGCVNLIVYTVGLIELFRGISLDWG